MKKLEEGKTVATMMINQQAAYDVIEHDILAKKTK